jgi:Rieske Fe-S protein
MATNRTELDREYPDHLPFEEQPYWRQDFATDVPEDDLVARREFVKFLVLTSGAFVAGQCWIAGTSLTEHTGPYPEKKIISAESVKPNDVVQFRYPTAADPCVLIRTGDGKLLAYSQKCTHLSCAVIPEPEKGIIFCPCHNGSFDLMDGRPIAGPPPRPLPRITLAERGGTIFATGVELRSV